MSDEDVKKIQQAIKEEITASDSRMTIVIKEEVTASEMRVMGDVGKYMEDFLFPRLEGIETRLDGVEKKLDSLEVRTEQIDRKLDHFSVETA